jgi:hypothetical protein
MPDVARVRFTHDGGATLSRGILSMRLNGPADDNGNESLLLSPISTLLRCVESASAVP